MKDVILHASEIYSLSSAISANTFPYRQFTVKLHSVQYRKTTSFASDYFESFLNFKEFRKLRNNEAGLGDAVIEVMCHTDLGIGFMSAAMAEDQNQSMPFHAGLLKNGWIRCFSCGCGIDGARNE